MRNNATFYLGTLIFGDQLKSFFFLLAAVASGVLLLLLLLRIQMRRYEVPLVLLPPSGTLDNAYYYY